MEERKTVRGRPRKGNRAPTVAAKFPLDHASVYEACAKELGLPLGDFVALCMAELFASRAQSDAERDHFAIPDYIAVQLAAQHEQAAQADLLVHVAEEATRAA
jgi:hypothetical protein